MKSLFLLLVLVHTTTTTAILEITSTSQFNLQVAPVNLTVVQFYLPWCPYCQYMEPEFAKLAVANPEVVFVSVNADVHRALAYRLGVRSVPTYKYMRSGRVVDSVSTWQPGVVGELVRRWK